MKSEDAARGSISRKPRNEIGRVRALIHGVKIVENQKSRVGIELGQIANQARNECCLGGPPVANSRISSTVDWPNSGDIVGPPPTDS